MDYLEHSHKKDQAKRFQTLIDVLTVRINASTLIRKGEKEQEDKIQVDERGIVLISKQ